MNVTFDESAFRQLRRNSKVFENKVLMEANTGLKRIAATIVARAKQILKDKGSVATGMLRNSGSVRPQVDGTVDAGYYADYAYWVEYGRKAGGMPPLKPIEEWVRKKHLASDPDQIKSIAYAIAKSISENGTKAKPFLTPSYLEYNDKVDEIIQKAINEVVNNFNGR